MGQGMERAHSAEDVVRIARGWIGTPYHHQASVKDVGTDCLGLVRGVWRELYGSEEEKPPPYAADWAEAIGRETLLEAAERHLVARKNRAIRAGDVLVFRYRQRLVAKHVGVASDTLSFIHAIEGRMVAEVPLSNWWRRRIVGVFRFPGVHD